MRDVIALFDLKDRACWEMLALASLLITFGLNTFHGYPVAPAIILSLVFLLIIFSGLYIVGYMFFATMSVYGWLANKR